jgi:hypothetical protein
VSRLARSTTDAADLDEFIFGDSDRPDLSRRSEPVYGLRGTAGAAVAAVR